MNKSTWIALIVFFLLATGIVLFSSVMSKSLAASRAEREAQEQQASDYEACDAAQHFIKNKLSAPSSAEFAPCYEPDTVAVATGDLWTVRSWVDAQNAFGVMLRADTVVTMTYDLESETFTLVDFAMDTR